MIVTPAKRKRVLREYLKSMCQGLALCLALAAGTAATAAPRSVQGMVSSVVSGDVVWLTPAGKPAIEVHLRDIDAPETCQPWGEESRRALADLALNKVATLQISGRQGRGFAVGFLMVEDVNTSRFMVENGHAWSIRTRWDQGPLVKQEKMARALSRGLHGQIGSVQPKEFRRLHGACPPVDAAPADSGASAAARP
jgi:micrococcal nuclease